MKVRKRIRRAVRPGLERVEGRELLSGVIAAQVANRAAAPSAVARLSARLHAAPAGDVQASTVAVGNGAAQGNTFVDNYASALLGNGTPTPKEAARETFRAVFTGRFYTGPGRYSDQARTDFYRGIGGSNFFLHGDFDMAVVTPTDPDAPLLGQLVFQDKSSNSNGQLSLILTGRRADVDALGRPTHLTFVADPNIYGGIFFAGAGEGTVDVRYGANKSIQVHINGRVYTNGLTSPLVNADFYSRHGRPLRFHGR